MLSSSKLFLLAPVVLFSLAVCAQETYKPAEANLLARLSYDSSIIQGQDEVRHVCLAVSANGDYRIERRLLSGQIQRLHGKVPQEQFEQLKKLLESADFRNISGNHGGVIFQDSESFMAELPLPGDGRDRAKRVQWLDADGGSPFPKPISKVVGWMQRFDPKDGKMFDYAEFPTTCPSVGMRLLQPSVATNRKP